MSYINTNGVWQSISKMYANVNGTWQYINSGWVNVNGTWKQFFNGVIIPVNNTLPTINNGGYNAGVINVNNGSWTNAVDFQYIYVIGGVPTYHPSASTWTTAMTDSLTVGNSVTATVYVNARSSTGNVTQVGSSPASVTTGGPQAVTVSSATLPALTSSSWTVNVNGSGFTAQPPSNITVGSQYATGITYSNTLATGTVTGLTAGTVYSVTLYNGYTPVPGSVNATAGTYSTPTPTPTPVAPTPVVPTPVVPTPVVPTPGVPTPTPTPTPVALIYCPSLGYNVPASGYPGNCPGA